MLDRFSSLQTIRNKSRTKAERGNALIYVLIAIALFAALSFTVGRQTGNNQEAGTLRPEEIELAASRVLSYAAQAEASVDQMMYTNTTIDELDFVLPDEADFDTEPVVDKVYHPGGGGLVPGSLDPKVIAQVSLTPPAGWYLGRFNSMEWTESTATDVILTAHQIHQDICADINLKLTGNAAIPAINGGSLPEFLIDARFHSGSNSDFEISDCASCEDFNALCVSDTAAGTTIVFTM